MNKLVYDLLTDPERPGLKEEDMKALLSKGFCFGSYVYGDPKTAEDFDIAVYFQNPREFDVFIGDKLIYVPGEYAENDFGCFYGFYHGKIINVMLFHDRKIYNKYLQVTEVLKALKKTEALSEKMNNKIFRVKMFEYFLDQV